MSDDNKVYGASVQTDGIMPIPWVRVGELNGTPVWIAPLGTSVPNTDRKITACHRDKLAQ